MTDGMPAPILPGFHPDPSVLRDEHGFLVATSTFEYFPGIALYRSADLRTWRHVGSAIDRVDQLPGLAHAPDSGGLYAPTLRRADGVYHLACTIFSRGRPEQSFYVTATDPAGPWSDPVLLDGARGMDPDLFFDEGRAWWTGCRVRADARYAGDTEIWMRELDLTEGRLVGDEHVLWRTALRGAVWGEAPHLYRRGEWYYLVTAEGGTAGDHAVMVARSASVTGPYVGSPRNPVLTHRHLGPTAVVQSVGHADLVEDEHGRTWLVCLATRPRDGHHVLGRETFLAAVEWVDGWPVVNPGRGVLHGPVGHPSHAAPSADDGVLTVRAASGFARQRPDGWTIHGRDDALDGGGQPAALLRRLVAWDECVGMDLDLAGEGRAGLVLRQSDRFHLRLEVSTSDGGVEIVAVSRRDGADEVLARRHRSGTGPVRLEARLRARAVELLAGDEGALTVLAEGDLAVLSTELAGGFVGATAGPYVVGVGTVATVTRWTRASTSPG